MRYGGTDVARTMEIKPYTDSTVTFISAECVNCDILEVSLAALTPSTSTL